MYNDHIRVSEAIRFTWDGTKAAANERKHGISFTEASSAFLDPFARVIADPEHSEEEDRFVLVGMSLRGTLVVVCHCLRDGGATIRIISSRAATRREEGQYWRYRA